MAIAGLYKIFDHWHKEGTLFIYSDPHFDDAELATGVVNRPTSEEQVKMINVKVGRRDKIIFLGDIGNVEWVKKIRGYKILIMGNHDSGRTNYERHIYEESFSMDEYSKEEALSAMREKYPNCHYTVKEHYQFHGRFAYWAVYADNQLFDEIFEGPVMLGEKLILSHEPVNIPWAFNIHGHIHDSKHKNDKHHLNVCADVIGYTPINMNQFMKSGALSHIETIRRNTIDKATERKAKRSGKKIRG